MRALMATCSASVSGKAIGQIRIDDNIEDTALPRLQQRLIVYGVFGNAVAEGVSVRPTSVLVLFCRQKAENLGASGLAKSYAVHIAICNPHPLLG